MGPMMNSPHRRTLALIAGVLLLAGVVVRVVQSL
jgi:hypothetical protein